jgi:glycosyltransferase involved in cell wall biosynthesis
VRVALDATYSADPNPSGIAVYSRELLQGLIAEHPDDEFLLCYRPKQFRRAPHTAYPNVHKRPLLPPLPTFRADLFHGLNQRIDKRSARSVVSTFHDLFVITGEYSTPEFRARFAKQAKHAAANSDVVIAVSDFTASQVRSLLGFDQKNIRVIPHGVHFPEGDVPDAAERSKMILFVGALQLRKNVSRLVSAFEATPSDWSLVLAGAPGGYQADRILEQIKRSQAHHRIKVCGYLTASQLEDLYRQASIFAFPSLDEGFGMPVLEAMAHGVPVLTSNRSGTAEIGSGAALLVDPCSEEAIAVELLRLIADPQLRTTLAEKGRARAREYSWQRTCDATYATYAELRGA